MATTTAEQLPMNSVGLENEWPRLKDTENRFALLKPSSLVDAANAAQTKQPSTSSILAQKIWQVI